MEFCSPNLPSKKVNTVIISGEYKYVIDELNNLGVNAVATTPNIFLPYPERYHADMQCIYYNKGKIYISNSGNAYNAIFVKKSTNIGIKINTTNKTLNPKYPGNILFNHVILNNDIICNIKYTERNVLKYCEKQNFRIINVNQGYTKCSIAVVNDDAIITSDNGIFYTCKKYGFDVLKIQPGYVMLPNYNYGFIGGCCGKLSHDTLAFTGKISEHPDYKKIKAFLHNYRINILELSNKPLLDIGSIIPVTQESDYKIPTHETQQLD